MQPETKNSDEIAKPAHSVDRAPSADGPDDLDPESLAAIRSLLTDQDPDVAKKRNPDPQRAARKADGFPAIAPADHAADAHPQAAPQKAASSKKSKQAAQSPKLSMKQRLAARSDVAKARITGYRPTVKHIVLASLALLVFFRPWLIVGVVFLSLFVLFGIFLILGYDGFWRRAMGMGHWYARRRPERSAELHRKLDTFAMRWDAILDRFPEGSVDGLYMPDFGELAHADARHDAAMERRLDGLRDSEASA